MGLLDKEWDYTALRPSVRVWTKVSEEVLGSEVKMGRVE